MTAIERIAENQKDLPATLGTRLEDNTFTVGNIRLAADLTAFVREWGPAMKPTTSRQEATWMLLAARIEEDDE